MQRDRFVNGFDAYFNVSIMKSDVNIYVAIKKNIHTKYRLNNQLYSHIAQNCNSNIVFKTILSLERSTGGQSLEIK